MVGDSETAANTSEVVLVNRRDGAPQRSERPSPFLTVALPCDQFGHQEPGSDGEIAAFCRRTTHSVSNLGGPGGSFLEFFSRNWLKAK
jgi:Glutathione peroxidase